MIFISSLPLIVSLLLAPIAEAKSLAKHHHGAPPLFSSIEEDLPVGTPQSPITIMNEDDSLFSVTAALASSTVSMTNEDAVLTLVRLDDDHPSYLTVLFSMVNASFKSDVRVELSFAKDGNMASSSYSFDSFSEICKPAGLTRTEYECALEHHLAETIGPIRLPKPSSLPDWAQSGVLSCHIKVFAKSKGGEDVTILEASFFAITVDF